MRIKDQRPESWMIALDNLKLIHINAKSVIVEFKEQKFFLHVKLYNELLKGNVLDNVVACILEGKNGQEISWLLILTPKFY